MKPNRAGFWILISLAFLVFTTGCPPAPKPPEKPAEPKPVASSSLAKPPPREALPDTPDLYESKLAVTDAGLEAMRADGVPGDVADKLGALKGRDFGNAKEFLDAVSQAIGAEALAANREPILRHALAMNLPAEPAFPGETLQLAAEYETIFFDFDRFNIKPEFGGAIKSNADALIARPEDKVLIEGHADERGTTEYNLALGERRARAVQTALIEQGVNANQLTIVSHGEERPANPGHDEAAWAENRRAVFTSQ